MHGLLGEGLKVEYYQQTQLGTNKHACTRLYMQLSREDMCMPLVPNRAYIGVQ